MYEKELKESLGSEGNHQKQKFGKDAIKQVGYVLGQASTGTQQIQSCGSGFRVEEHLNTRHRDAEF